MSNRQDGEGGHRHDTAHGHGHAHDHEHAPHGHDDHAHHDHGHGLFGHAGHAHGNVNERRVFWAAALTGGFTLVELVGGLLAGSLALIADAGHMLTDSAGLFLAWLAFRIARRPADRRRTYGFDRMEVLVAFGNGLFLIVLSAIIFIEALRRLASPVEVEWLPMLVVATGGLLVNIAAFFILHGAERDNLNIRGAVLHVLGDLLGSVAAIGAALIIMATGWLPIDPILSVLVTVLILVSAWRLVRDSAHILLEGAPADISGAEIEPDITSNVAGVLNVHHVHVWSISQQRPMVTLHACIAEDASATAVTAQIKQRLRDRFGVDHATVEVEHGVCADDLVDPPLAAHG